MAGIGEFIAGRNPPTRRGEVGSASHMKAQVAPLEGNKVKLSVEVEEADVEKAIDETFAKFAKELRVPGFRPGKTPRPGARGEDR